MHVGMATGLSHYGPNGEDAPYPDARFVREELEKWVLAEELGLDSVWITEHHFTRHSLSPDPLMYLSYLAGRTRRLRLGTQVLVLPWHDPVRVAEQIIQLDHVSSGRVILGVGRGMARREFNGLRLDQNTARERYDEMLQLIVPALETGVMEGGEIFRQPRVELRPRPFRSFKGRVFGAFGSPPSQELAARLGLGRLYTSALPVARPASARPMPDVYLSTWKETHGEDSAPPPPFASGVVVVDPSADRAIEIARTYGGNSLRVGIEHYEMRTGYLASVKGYEAFGSIRLETDAEVEQAVDNFTSQIIAGTPDQVLSQLEAMRDKFSPQGLFPQLFLGGMPDDEAVRNMRYFAETCLPELKSWPARSTVDAPADELEAAGAGARP